MVVPLVEALLLRVLRRRAADAPANRPTRLVSLPHHVDAIGYVAEGTSVLLVRPGSRVEVLPAGSLVLPALLGRPPAYAVVCHEPVEVWLRIGPFDTLDERTVRQVELQLTVTLSDSPSGLRDLLDSGAPSAASSVTSSATSSGAARDGYDAAPAPASLDLGSLVLDRLARELTSRTTEAVRRRTLRELTGLSLGVLLDQALPRRFLGGLLERSVLEVVDVDWPTEGRGWSTPPAPDGASVPHPVSR